MMTRRVPITNGVQNTIEGPPPSTLAAQIVQNQARHTGPPHSGEAAIFTQLLQEILADSNIAPEKDINVNVQLICVVAEAGLAPLVQDIPSSPSDVLLAQARDSLAVIENTIKLQPEVLFTAVSDDGPQLLLPLLARLTALCGRQGCRSLQIPQLLDTVTATVTDSAELWQNANIIKRAMQDTMNEAISSLDAASYHTRMISIDLPPARTVLQLWPSSRNAVALPRGCQTNINDSGHAVMLVLQLLQTSVLRSASPNEAGTRMQKLIWRFHQRLEDLQEWARAVEQLLSLPDNSVLLNALVRHAANTPVPMAVQSVMARGLLNSVRQADVSTCDRLLPGMRALANEQAFDKLHEDLRIAITTWLTRYCSEDQLPERILALRDALRHESVMTDGDLQTAFRELSVAPAAGPSYWRTRKRRKITHPASLAHLPSTGSQIESLCAMIGTNEVQRFPETILKLYPTLNENDQCNLWLSLASLSQSEVDIAFRSMAGLVQLPSLRDRQRARIHAVLAVSEAAGRSADFTLLDIAKSPLGQFCLSSLHSSVRELRIAAGRSLPGFLRSDLPDHIRDGNRQTTMEYLRALSDRDAASEHESTIYAWGQMATICGDRELNLILIRLVDYLGHPNSLICALAVSELENVASVRGETSEELLKPFWNTIAPSAVRDLHTRPQKVQQLCEALKTDINDFLRLTQNDTIPILVLTKKRDVLQRIATARGNGATVKDLCLQPPTNLAATVALLLSQHVADPEVFTLDCLTDAAPWFKGQDLAEIVRSQPVLIACELLKHTADATRSRKSRAYLSFQVFANLAGRRPGQAKANSKSNRAIAEFLDAQILGIMAHFSHVLESPVLLSTTSEKIRCLNAVADMVQLGKAHVGVGLPQIRACLQSAIEHAELREAAFSAWLILLSVLDPDHLAGMLDQTFALVVQFWTRIPPNLQQDTHAKIADLLKSHNKIVLDQLMTLPSLCGIPLLSKIASEIERLKEQESKESHFKSFQKRLQGENKGEVYLALTELVPFLEQNQEYIHDTAVSEQPASIISGLLRALLNVTVTHSTDDMAIASMCGKALGIVGCLDPNRIETARKRRQVLVLSNFDTASEVVDWVLAMLDEVYVKAFRSNTNAHSQGFLAYVMQTLLGFCGFNETTALRPRSSQAPSIHQQWMSLPEHTRIVLTPFLTSKYTVTGGDTKPPNRPYPNFSAETTHRHWLRFLVYDLMFKGKGDNAVLIFPVIARTVRGHDLAIASFLLPYAILNVVLGGTVGEVQDMRNELLAVLQCKPTSNAQLEMVNQSSESVFGVLEYMTTWLQEKKKALGNTRTAAYTTGHSPKDFNEAKDMAQIEEVAGFLASIPAEAIASRAMECGSYARALYHWEQFIRQKRVVVPSVRMSQEEEKNYETLQHIYAQIDEPDGLEGIGSHLAFLTEEQQVVHHAKSGRWAAAQAWYELRLAAEPGDTKVQASLLECLRETGQHAALLRYAEGFIAHNAAAVDPATPTAVEALAMEARIMTCDLHGLKAQLGASAPMEDQDFNSELGRLLVAVSEREYDILPEQLSDLRVRITQGMTEASISSLHACHGDLRKLHSLYELEAMTSADDSSTARFATASDKRLAALGSHVPDKQYILGVRRAIMRSRYGQGAVEDMGPSWLSTARLARKANNTQSAYNAVLQAFACGDKAAKLEEAKLLWHDGHQRLAIQALESAISSGIFDTLEINVQATDDSSERSPKQNMSSAKAHLTLAKWLDAAGQSQAKDMTARYQHAARNFQRWEKGHYYLGKHYNKLLEAEKALPSSKQSALLSSGEMAKLVFENFMRSIPFGNKYWHQTIPKMLTLWLDLGMQTMSKPAREDPAISDRRSKALTQIHKQLQKYLDRVPAYVFYAALPQLISRISHPHPEVWKYLSGLLVKIGSAHPSEALWSLLAIAKASDRMRVERGTEILNRLKDPKNSTKKTDAPGTNLRQMITQGQKLSDGLLQACEAHIEPRTSTASLSKTLNFNHKLAPSALVVPLEATLNANTANRADMVTIRRHVPFAQDKITIQSFADEVLVLSSLQRPRKILARGSDGKQYGLLCKPKDDLRKDQRLMEFNGIINRALKQDAGSSKRQLYIKTYAVTPLSEESGILEWVEGIKPIRDILLNAYRRKGIQPNYNEIKINLNEACTSPERAHLFVDKVQSEFPPLLHEWFSETYSQPETWFTARLRYTRSAAVMSMTGHVLGLGDRHGENILLEQGTGGVFHVDFNCLFDKGMTFEKPELVPFRLTPNMVDAMGAYGYEGPFRKSSELALSLLRQNKDTLMTVLETFLYDPTTDFVGKKKRTTPGVPETPQEILDSVEAKLKGLLRGETVPLSVEGYVDALIQQAVSNFNLASMYIGWCAFL